MKTETQQFIEDAINGGYTSGNMINNNISYEDNFKRCALDPKAWEAVAGTRGWDWAYCYTCKSRVPLWGQCECDEDEQQPEAVMAWHRNWHRFIDHLAEGKTIEQALLAIK